jgi:hypothetical protein
MITIFFAGILALGAINALASLKTPKVARVTISNTHAANRAIYGVNR